MYENLENYQKKRDLKPLLFNYTFVCTSCTFILLYCKSAQNVGCTYMYIC